MFSAEVNVQSIVNFNRSPSS